MAERIYSELVADLTSQQMHCCVGLDTRMSAVRKQVERGLFKPSRDGLSDLELVTEYNYGVIDATRLYAAAYKPNLALYKELGAMWPKAVIDTVNYAKEHASHALTIIDGGKYGDIGDSTEGHAKEAFGLLGGDAATVQNYFGRLANKAFLDRKDKGTIIMGRTSNPGCAEFQDLNVKLTRKELNDLLNGPARQVLGRRALGIRTQMRLFEYVTLRVADHWNENGNCGLVAGATFPGEAGRIRQLVGPKVLLLIPGVGAQGGKAADIVPVALRAGEFGLINSSRAISFPEIQEGEKLWDVVERAAFALHNEIVTSQDEVT